MQTLKYWLIFCFSTLIWKTEAVAEYVMPIGIPAPNWGALGNPVDLVAPVAPSPWTTNIPDTYYIEQGGTNPGNGYPGNPRGVIPQDLTAGSTVFVNGTITHDHYSQAIRHVGTEAEPCWITSFDPETPAIFTQAMQFGATCRYLFVDGVHWQSTAGPGGIIVFPPGPKHVCIRNFTITGPGTVDGTDSTGAYNQTSIQWVDPVNYGDTEQIVIYNGTVTKSGNWQYATGDPDAAGSVMGLKMQDIWFLNVDFSYSSGCSVQIGGGTTPSTEDDTVCRRIYIGKCTSHHTAQTSFFSKRTNDVIFSQNSAHTIRRDAPSSPNSGGFGAQYGPRNLWFIGNKTNNCQTGMLTAGGASSIVGGTGGLNYRVVGAHTEGATVLNIEKISPPAGGTIPADGFIEFAGDGPTDYRRFFVEVGFDGVADSGTITVKTGPFFGTGFIAGSLPLDDAQIRVWRTISNTPTYYVGNVVHDIHDEEGSTPETWRGDNYGSVGHCIGNWAQSAYIVNNTFYDYDTGVSTPSVAAQMYVDGNIFANRTGTGVPDVNGSSIPITCDHTTDTLTSVGHGFVSGDRIRIASSGGFIPYPLYSADVTYFVIRLTNDTFKLATSAARGIAGTPVINLTDNGSGTITAFSPSPNQGTDLNFEGENLASFSYNLLTHPYVQNDRGGAGTALTSIASINSAFGPGNIGTAPTFMDAGNGNFNLQLGSAGIDAAGSVANYVYDLYQTNYGIDIRRDYNGGNRPNGVNWDIGAFEQGSEPPPPAITFSVGNHVIPGRN